MNLPATSPEEFVESVTGHSVTGGGYDSEGLHLFLDDGRVVIIMGYVFIGTMEKETLQ